MGALVRGTCFLVCSGLKQFLASSMTEFDLKKESGMLKVSCTMRRTINAHERPYITSRRHCCLHCQLHSNHWLYMDIQLHNHHNYIRNGLISLTILLQLPISKTFS